MISSKPCLAGGKNSDEKATMTNVTITAKSFRCLVSSTYLDAIEPTHPQTILINFRPLEKVQGKRRDRNGDW
jgi:hypothetical protein